MASLWMSNKMGHLLRAFVKSVKKTHEKISEASMYFLEKCGHVCSIEKYREFNGLVVSFLHGC